MLIKDFYTIQTVNQTDTQNLCVTIQLNSKHEVFKGHFPDNPVTPGVCMIQTIKEITETHVSKPLFLKYISNVKFTALINPDINPDLILELTLVEDNETVKVKNITKFTDGTIALKCNGTFVKQ